MTETTTPAPALRLLALALLLLGLVLCIGLLATAGDFSTIALNPQPEPPG
ncbi:hypothetical protein [Pseudonocardia lacus]|nr:hypothetical protein [Pseudonocardia lacus]